MEKLTMGQDGRTTARALALLGGGKTGASGGNAHESSEGGAPEIGARDEERLAARIAITSSLDETAAAAVAADLTQRARATLAKIREDINADVSPVETSALESVIQVRGRPAIRLVKEHGSRLESLTNYPGSDFWQPLVDDYESRIVGSAAVTGAAVVSLFGSGLPAWVQGSAWLASPDRVVTNRHVLLNGPEGKSLIEEATDGKKKRLRPGCSMMIEFAGDDRTPAEKITRRVTGVLYVSKPRDPVDVAVLAIEPYENKVPLRLAEASAPTPGNLFVVGHPGLMSEVPEEVKAVFGRPDGKKRVSFGKLLPAANLSGNIAHDASTLGGYSGGPVIGISDGTVTGLHFYGDPVSGNLAVSAAALRAHAAHQFMVDAT